MSVGAIVMMLLAIIVLWGGLALAVFNITRPQRPSNSAAPVDDSGSTSAGSPGDNR